MKRILVALRHFGFLTCTLRKANNSHKGKVTHKLISTEIKILATFRRVTVKLGFDYFIRMIWQD